MKAARAYAPHRRLVAGLFGTLKLMQMYGRSHTTTTEALGNLVGAVVEAAEDGDLVVSVRGSRVQVNGLTMRASDCGALALSFLAEEWTRRHIEHVRMAPPVDTGELATFAAALLDAEAGPEAPDRIAAALARAGCGAIIVERREHDDDPVLLEERRESAMRTYLRGLRAFKEVLRLEGLQDRTRVRRARRAVQGLVDNFLEDESAVLALAQIRGYDMKLFHHSLNTCIYAVLLGQRLGMTRRQLGELGLAALFHDLGKTAKREAEAAPETPWETIRRHPGRGARLLLEEGTAHEGMLKAAIAAYEHHAHYDRSGFPEIDHQPHLVSRIVAIADCYESLVSQRTYRDVPYTPYDALSLMQTRAGTLFDPLILKVFVNALGVYPVGSLVALDTGEIAMVVEGPADATRLDCPRVRVVKRGEGTLEPGTVLDLLRPDAGRTIGRTLVADEVFGDMGEHVSAI